MPELRVYLADGFQNDRVVIRANGNEVFSGDSVTTSPLISLADEVAFPVPSGTVEIEVELPMRGLDMRIDLGPGDGRFLAVSVENGRIEHITSRDPLGFQ